MLISREPHVRNEQIKLAAAYINAIAIAIMVVGVLTPVFVMPERLQSAPFVPFLAFLASLVVHFAGNRLLRFLSKGD